MLCIFFLLCIHPHACIHNRTHLSLMSKQGASSPQNLPGKSEGRADVHRVFVVEDWSERRQAEMGDCFGNDSVPTSLAAGQLDFVRNNVVRLRGIWDQFTFDDKVIFSQKFGHIGALLGVEVDWGLIRAALEFWDPSFRCFSFNMIDLAPTYEEYTNILGIYSDFPIKMYLGEKEIKRVEGKLHRIFGIEQDSTRKNLSEKGGRKVMDVGFLWPIMEDQLASERGMKLFALMIYGLVLLPTVANSIDIHVISFFERMVVAKANPVLVILAETYRSLNYCTRNSRGKFHACVQLLNLWLTSHFESTMIHKSFGIVRTYHAPRSRRAQSESNEPEEPKDKDQWMLFLRNLENGELRWRSVFCTTGNILWKCQGQGYLPLLGVWGAIGYTPLLVLRQYGITQFVPATDYLIGESFNYDEAGSNSRVQGIVEAWRQVDYILTEGEKSTAATEKYLAWSSTRCRDVVALKNWVIDPVNFRPPEKEKRLVDKYRDELNRKVNKFNTTISLMERDLAQQKSEVRSQQLVIQCDRDKKRKLAQEKEEVEAKNAKLNDTIQRLCRFMDIRMVKASEVDDAIRKATARQVKAYDEEKKKADHYRQTYVNEKQRWEEEKRKLKDQLEINRKNYEQELLCRDQNVRHMTRELKEKDREIKHLQNIGQSSTDWEEKYEEIKAQMDYQLHEKDRHYESLQQNFVDLQFNYEQAQEEMQYRREEMDRLQQAYEKNAINMTDRWTKEKQAYADEIKEITSKVDRAIEEASKIYEKIQDYREENIGEWDHPHSLTAFLDEILLLASHVERIIRN